MTIAQTRLDDLWDFSDAASSEARLREAAEQAPDDDDRAELETQVADAGRFGDALTSFERSRDAALRWGTPQQVRWADEAIAEARSAFGS